MRLVVLVWRSSGLLQICRPLMAREYRMEHLVAAGKMELLLEVGRIEMYGGAELTMIHTYINVQKCDFGGGGVPAELDGIAAVGAFKELGEGAGSMGPKKENVINKT